MKTQVIISAFLFGAFLLTAQESKQTTTVRVKKIENINGVEKMTDTTYTINGPVDLKSVDGLNKITPGCNKDGKPQKVVIVTDQITGNDDGTNVVTKGEVMDEQVERALKEAGVDGKAYAVDKMVLVNVDTQEKEENGEKKTTKIVVIKKIKITAPSDADTKMLGKETGMADGKLAVDRMNFYPNPGNGKFNLTFSLADKGDTHITILDMQGKAIYAENLDNFSGTYDKEIDISKNPKGIYFVKIEQGSHAQLKKIVLE
jgi:hypothetical protein